MEHSTIVVLPADQFEAIIARAVVAGVQQYKEQEGAKDSGEPLMDKEGIKAVMGIGERAFQTYKKRRIIKPVTSIGNRKLYRQSQFTH
jgi:hypothetical protein